MIAKTAPDTPTFETESRSYASPATASGPRGLFLRLLDRSLPEPLVVLVEGQRYLVGPRDRLTERTPILRVARDRFFARVLGEGNLGMGESFMDGDFLVEGAELYDVQVILLKGRIDHAVRGDWRTGLGVARVQAVNVVRRHQWRQVQQHYDLGDDLFESFLDSSMTYSCGYADSPDDSLEDMQFNKLDRICRKLALAPGDHVLDIGCGFGGLLIHAARHYGATGVGITTSARHAARGNGNIAAAGLGDRIRLELRDHRTIDGSFDKVVSVGMMEHLPRREYGRYFDRIAAVLRPHGVGLVHVIGCVVDRNDHDPFIQKYIFPGSGQVKLSEIARACEARALAIRDVENMCRHYAYTARHWLRNFRANQARLDPTRYDARFCRMWEYYLHCAVAAGFASEGALWQVLFMKDYSGHMPLRRV